MTAAEHWRVIHGAIAEHLLPTCTQRDESRAESGQRYVRTHQRMRLAVRLGHVEQCGIRAATELEHDAAPLRQIHGTGREARLRPAARLAELFRAQRTQHI